MKSHLLKTQSGQHLFYENQGNDHKLCFVPVGTDYLESLMGLDLFKASATYVNVISLNVEVN